MELEQDTNTIHELPSPAGTSPTCDCYDYHQTTSLQSLTGSTQQVIAIQFPHTLIEHIFSVVHHGTLITIVTNTQQQRGGPGEDTFTIAHV